jgi:hypothetical protein
MLIQIIAFLTDEKKKKKFTWVQTLSCNAVDGADIQLFVDM